MVAARPRREFHDKILHPIPVHIPPEPECNWKWESPQCRFGQLQTNNHSSFGVRRLVAAMARASEGKRRQVAALHIGLVICPSFAPIRRQKLTPTSSKCTA